MAHKLNVITPGTHIKIVLKAHSRLIPSFFLCVMFCVRNLRDNCVDSSSETGIVFEKDLVHHNANVANSVL